MGEVVPGAVRRVPDASQACAEITEAAALHDLDAFLQRAALIVRERFEADVVLLRVHRHARGLYWAPLSGQLAGDAIFPNWETFRDPQHAARVQALVSNITPDLALEPKLSPAQKACFDRGVRSTAWTALKDERGDALGFLLCGSLRPNAFDAPVLRELEGLASQIAWQVRPAILIEEQEAERSLLAEESRLLTEIAEADTEPELYAHVAEGIRRALKGDLTLAMVDSPGNRPPVLFSAPPDALTSEQWRSARAALMSGQNGSMNERSREEGAFAIADLSDDAPTPIERWMRDELGMRALAAANRSHQWGGLGLGLTVLRQRPGVWTLAERDFLARIARTVPTRRAPAQHRDLVVHHLRAPMVIGPSQSDVLMPYQILDVGGITRKVARINGIITQR